MNPTEIVAFDFDKTLYDSPGPPNGDPLWWFHAGSLSEWKPPGFDARWNLELLTKARHDSLRPEVLLILLTARPDHKAMRAVFKKILNATGISWRSVHLKPLLPPESDDRYKARVVLNWIRKHPSIKKVTFYDDKQKNLLSVGRVARVAKRQYDGIRIGGRDDDYRVGYRNYGSTS